MPLGSSAGVGNLLVGNSHLSKNVQNYDVQLVSLDFAFYFRKMYFNKMIDIGSLYYFNELEGFNEYNWNDN
ncbi:hypothetical protein QTP88_012225 [Uroleucon formosanum]